MTSAAGFQFLHPLWLLLMVPGWTLVWLYARRVGRDSAWRRVCDPHLLARMTAGQAHRSRPAPVVWIVAAVTTLAIIAAAAPSWSRIAYPVLQAGSARVIVLDLSRAMLVQDVRPSRYRHAVAAAGELIGDGFDGETGLVVFAGSAFVLAPLCRDADALLAFIEAVHPDSMPQDGANLSRAIATAQGLLSASFSGHGRILLISAGDSDDESAVQAAAAAAAQGHRVSVLAIGSEAGGPLLTPQNGLLRDTGGKIRISKTNFALLRQVAVAGKGSLAITPAGIGSGDLLISRLGASQMAGDARADDPAAGEAGDDGAWLVWLMLPLVFVLFRKNVLLLLLLLVFAPAEHETYAGDADAFWTHSEQLAFAAYQRGEFETAAELTDDPFLRGASYYRRGQYELALQQFGDRGSAASMYNRANTLVRLQRYAEAVTAYGEALALAPDLGAARYNKRLLELFLQQQSASAVADGDRGDTDDAPLEERKSQHGSTARIGIATAMDGNPADDPQAESGYGAAQQPGQLDPVERFDGEEAAQERFVPRALAPGDAVEFEFVERWISSLPESSSELYRRKFLRDFRRQQQQPR